jgi:hypothetical protein
MSLDDPRTPQPLRPLPEGWRQRLVRASPLARDVAIIMLVKAGALVLLCWAFFASPFGRQLGFEQKGADRQWLTVPPSGDAARAVR